MRELFAIVVAVGLGLGCGGTGDAPTDGGEDGPGPGSDGPPPDAVPVAPVAPAAGKQMYQGSQREFRTQLGGTCRGRVAASMGGTGFCYLAADDHVKCAGVIGEVDFGMVPQSIGQTGATQIMVFFPFEDGMCIAKADRTVQCMGTNTRAFGSSLSKMFGRWIDRDDIEAIASGTWDQICGITTAGQVYCGGLGNPAYGNPPIAVGDPGRRSFWVDASGGAQLDDAAVLRPGESRTDCQVRAGGLVCDSASFGPSDGTLVSGTRSLGNPDDVTCWLDSTATVTCSTGPRFERGKVLFLAAAYHTDSMCAIYVDGSVWCIGTNANGKLGTGTTATLATETMVAPPGSARVRCD